MFQKADKTKLRTKEEKLAKDIIEFLLTHEIFDDTYIYVNGKRYGTYDGEGHYNYGTSSWNNVYVEEDKDPKKYCEYAGNILSISSEGFLYDAMNYGFEWDTKLPDELDEIFKKHGYYLEACTSWFWTAVKL